MHPSHCYCGGKQLLYDEGCLHIKNNGTNLLQLFYQSSKCYECTLLKVFNVSPGSTKHAIFQTDSDTLLEFVNGQKYTEYFKFGQHGHYNVTVNDDHISDIITYVSPEDAYAPLKVELWILFIIIALWSIGACTSYYLSTFRWLFQTNFVHRELLNDLGSPSDGGPVSSLTSEPTRSSPQSARADRVQSIDTFRGISLVLMVFVNYGGGRYWFFRHSDWNGLTIADLVYPSFAFVMGMSQLISITSLYRRTNSKNKVFLKIFLRSLVLITLGIMLNSFNQPNITRLRLPGVLQRLGLAYFIVGAVEILCLQTHFSVLDTERLPSLRQIVSCCGVVQWMIMLSFVVAHTCIQFLMTVPGCPQGYIGPGGLSMNSSAVNCTGGAARYIDQRIFTSGHMYFQKGHLYQMEVPFDPEGLLGTLTTSFTVFLGICATRIYLTCRNPRRLIFQWIMIGVICGLTAGFLCNWSAEGGAIPINKKLWSLSFTLALGSIGFLTISLLYFLTDHSRIWNGSPFKDVGKNSILIYVGHILLRKTFPWAIAPIDFTDHTEILLLNTWSTFLWIFIAVILAKNNIILAI